jgi:hypothetical protein
MAKCRKDKSGRDVRVWGWADTPSCQTNGALGVKHVVKVRNLLDTPVAATCNGLIDSDPRSARFVCNPPSSRVSDASWSITRNVPGNETITIRRVDIVSDVTGDEETISMTVSCEGVYGREEVPLQFLIDT